MTVGSLDLRANVNIKQIVEVVSDYDKYNKLLNHLKNFNDGSRVLIFVETKKGIYTYFHLYYFIIDRILMYIDIIEKMCFFFKCLKFPLKY